MIDDIDLEADGKQQIGTLEEVRKYAEQMRDLEKQIIELEKQLEEKKDEYHFIESKQLPEVMEACRIKDFTLESGENIEIKEIMKANIPSKSAIDKADDDKKGELQYRQRAALRWLRDNGLETIIKNTLEFEFSKGQDNLVGELIGQAEQLGIPHKREESVHAATLEKCLKEKIKANIEVPMDTFNIYTGKKAVMKLKKKK